MFSVAEATARVLATAAPLPAEQVPLTEAAGRILRADLTADRDFPPFARVTMDGIALAHAAFAVGLRTFPLEATQFAGEAPHSLRDPQAAVEIMTGAVLPPGTDTVVRYEDLTIRSPTAGSRIATLNPGLVLTCGQAVHRQGADRQAGDVLLPIGTRLSPAALAVAATIGSASVSVTRRARVAVVGTGDEAIPFTENPLPHQIRRSNGLMLQALVQQAGATADVFHLPDDADQLRQALPALLKGYDVVVLSGGVSKGRADLLPTVLREAGAEEIFHEVAQRPGKPLWFGQYPGGAVVFGLPGNPVSSFVSAVRYVRPWLRAASGQAPAPSEGAVLTEAVTFAPPLTYFLPVRLVSGPNGQLLATPQRDGGSGDLALLLTADGFLELPAARSAFAPGAVLPLLRG